MLIDELDFFRGVCLVKSSLLYIGKIQYYGSTGQQGHCDRGVTLVCEVPVTR